MTEDKQITDLEILTGLVKDTNTQLRRELKDFKEKCNTLAARGAFLERENKAIFKELVRLNRECNEQSTDNQEDRRSSSQKASDEKEAKRSESLARHYNRTRKRGLWC